jgi:predicted ATPase with chaperone activity
MVYAAIPAPQTVEQTGVGRSRLEQLALKVLYLRGELFVRDLGEHVCVNSSIVDELFQRLRKDQLCEVTGMAGGVHRIALTAQGSSRALELLSQNQYSGPAPVSLQDYVRQVLAQTVTEMEITPATVQKALEHLVMDADTIRQIGTALVSGRTMFLYGSTGSGKTTVAESLGRIFSDDQIWVPYAIDVDGEIITVYDPLIHKAVRQGVPAYGDSRWVFCRRPIVRVGGELNLEMLDLQLSSVSKFYSAPAQMKANNGLLIVDDFGRQRIRPEELLNRWVVPLDRRIDFLTLVGGRKIEVPFDVFLVFATNLDPASLADPAFMRRLPMKIRLGKVSREQFQEIFRRVCSELRLDYDPRDVEELMDAIQERIGEPLRACHPRDILHQICWAARYRQKQPKITWEVLAQACRNYFLGPAAEHSSIPSMK